MALSESELDTIARLSSSLGVQQRELERLDAYYEGYHRLERLGLAVPPELERFVTSVNWPRITVDSVEQRCDVEGFRLPGTDEADEDLWSVWQANGLDEESQQAHLDAMVLGRSYICVGSRGKGVEDEVTDPSIDSDVPLITVESPFEMVHEIAPRTRMVSAAMRRTRGYGSGWGTFATLYLPKVTVWLELRGSDGWVELDRDQHNLGVVPVVPLINRPRLRKRPGQARQRAGISEMTDVISLTDAACRALTNAQVATELLAVPQRYILGAKQQDFEDEQGNPVPKWEAYLASVWALMNEDAKVGQFDAADLKNFETIVNHYANLASGASGLPTRFYGQYTTNPPSEGSIVADETRLIMNAYRHHRSFGGSHEWAQRIARRLMDGDWNPDLTRMETLWRDPETPTRAQQADATVKLYTAQDPKGRPLLPRQAAWEDLGYSATRRQQLQRLCDEEDAQAAQNDPIARAAAGFRTGLEPGATANPEPAAQPQPGTPFADARPTPAGV